MPNAHIFDGFCHRPYDEETDGWMRAGPSESQYPVVAMARDVLELYNAVKSLAQENWRLRKEVRRLREMCGLPVEADDARSDEPN